MGQLVDELKPRFEQKVNFVIVFVDKAEEQPVAEKYNVQYVPATFLFDKGGDETNNYTGVVDKGVLTSKLEDLAK